MTTLPHVTVRRVESEADWQGAVAVRFAVFVDEQRVPADAELDALDAVSDHVVAVAGGGVVGTGRLIPEADGTARIGRVAVVQEWRGRGAGSSLLRFLEAVARERGVSRIVLHAQTHAVPFYERHGYRADDPDSVFDEDGIPHVAMHKDLLPRARREAT